MLPDVYFDTLHEAWDGQLVVCALGTNEDEWWRRTQDDTCFYMNAAMGFTPSFTLGLALAAPDQEIWLLNSDGGMAMNAGGLLTEASVQPGNVTHFVFDNHCYGSLMGHPIVNRDKTDYAAMARAAGIERVWTVDDPESCRQALEECRGLDAYGLIVAQIEWPSRREAFERVLQLGYEGPEMKYRFGRAMEKRLGRPVFDGRGC